MAGAGQAGRKIVMLSLVASLVLLGAGCSTERTAEDAAASSSAPDRPSAASGRAGPAAPDRSASRRPFRPAPGMRLPRRAEPLADLLAKATRSGLRTARAWSERSALRDRPPRALVLQALLEQRIVRALVERRDLAVAVLKRLPRSLRQRPAAALSAHRRLAVLAKPVPQVASYATGRPQPPNLLLRHYRRAERRFGVPWEVLAAVNLVESSFGRAREHSHAGAQGPMQFLPSTWAAYGLGGDINDPKDAILGAANYLRASGAPEDLEAALYAYNPSRFYVDAVRAYTRVIERRPAAFYVLYSWQLYVRTADGARRLTGPGTGPRSRP